MAHWTPELQHQLKCKTCFHALGDVRNAFTLSAQAALNERNVSVQGQRVLVQSFRNPLGTEFDLLLLRDAELAVISGVYMNETWFPGYGWSIAVCPRCGGHRGWMYSAVAPGGIDEFYGIVLKNVLLLGADAAEP